MVVTRALGSDSSVSMCRRSPLEPSQELVHDWAFVSVVKPEIVRPTLGDDSDLSSILTSAIVGAGSLLAFECASAADTPERKVLADPQLRPDDPAEDVG